MIKNLELQDISNPWKLNCLLKSLFRLTTNKSSMVCITSSFWPVDSTHKGPIMLKGFPCHDITMGSGSIQSMCDSKFIDHDYANQQSNSTELQLCKLRNQYIKWSPCDFLFSSKCKFFNQGDKIDTSIPLANKSNDKRRNTLSCLDQFMCNVLRLWYSRDCETV